MRPARRSPPPGPGRRPSLSERRGPSERSDRPYAEPERAPPLRDPPGPPERDPERSERGPPAREPPAPLPPARDPPPERRAGGPSRRGPDRPDELRSPPELRRPAAGSSSSGRPEGRSLEGLDIVDLCWGWCRVELGPAAPARRGPGRTRHATGRPAGPCAARGRTNAKNGEGEALSRLPFEKSGGVLLSQGRTSQVPSALEGLTSVFGMGTGVTPPLWPPKSVVN